MKSMIDRMLDEVCAGEFLAGASWSVSTPGGALDSRLQFLFGVDAATERATQEGLVRSLLSFRLPETPPGFKERDGYEPGDDRAPFFSEAFLYILLWKEDARSVLARVRDVATAFGLDPHEWSSRSKDPAVREVALQMERSLASVRADAYAAGVRWRRENPDADSEERRRAFLALYPHAYDVRQARPDPDIAMIELVSFVPEAAIHSAPSVDSIHNEPLLSDLVLNSVLGPVNSAALGGALDALCASLGVDRHATHERMRHERAEERAADAAREARMAEFARLRTRLRATGQYHRAAFVGRESDLRAAYPLRAETTETARAVHGTPLGTTFEYARRQSKDVVVTLYGFFDDGTPLHALWMNEEIVLSAPD